jgi:hypothetical protein
MNRGCLREKPLEPVRIYKCYIRTCSQTDSSLRRVTMYMHVVQPVVTSQRRKARAIDACI